MGPSVILDKSALEALSVDESVWLEAFLDVNVVPVFYVEVLADLEKIARHDQTPETLSGGWPRRRPRTRTRTSITARWCWPSLTAIRSR